MAKTAAPALPAPPSYVISGGLPDDIARNIRVVDASTGETIPQVIEADAGAGTVRRYDVQDGNLVREKDAFKIVEEERKIRMEWIEPPVVEPVEGEAEVTDQ
ncbi:hypothetical protein SAMN05192583_0889 [Sphingomonas gellani]|uniref:Uncharacterized protein n=1 Tax=Sphingomonas gellani TaxID=1166340 RepID=A0A1H7ZZ36_9SPHN|nr:hypothetical protein [Sphingomonas gellani]SEM62848.1 hypothetical protein SAMN05192583_0889 [Sphingomonas gellani]